MLENTGPGTADEQPVWAQQERDEHRYRLFVDMAKILVTSLTGE